jgi:hypothetical protein
MAANSSSSSPSSRECRLSRLSAESMMEEGSYEESSTKRVAPRKELERTVGGSNSVRSIATPPPQLKFSSWRFAEYHGTVRHPAETTHTRRHLTLLGEQLCSVGR